MIVQALWQLKRGEVIMVALSHLVAALLGLALIVVVHQTLFEPRLTLMQAGIGYSILLPLLFVIGVGSYRQLSRLGANVLAQLRMTLAEQILKMSYQQQQAMGSTRIHSLLTQDLVTLGDAFRALPLLAFNLALLGCSLLYMWWLSGLFFAFYLLILGLAFVTAAVLTKRSAKLMAQLRSSEEVLNGQFAAMVDGAKELKLNQVRSQHFLDLPLTSASEQLKNDTLAAEKHTSIMINWITVLVFVVLGGLLLVSGSVIAPEPSILSGFVIMTLFIRGPIVSIASFMPALVKGNVAWRQIVDLGFHLEPKSANHSDDSHKNASNDFSQLSLSQVRYHYPAQADEQGFQLGPIDLTIQQGQVIFIVGGNGSGKSTLAKVLTGLYPAMGGEIYINSQPIAKHQQLNPLFSSVFFDFQLFEHIIDAQGNNTSEDIIDGWLQRLEMCKKVNVTDAKLSTTKLSQGQRKRLALMVAACEDRPILLFDEWAADQDPHFRKIFYRQLLPYLQQQGKTVIAVTHDENYFDCADQLYRLDQGQLERIS